MNLKLPSKLKPIFYKKSRYKILYGGRGGCKSWSAATFFVLTALKTSIRVLCCREFQMSIKESVHKLLSDTIHRLELDDYFEILESTITCKVNKSEFIFIGIKNNITKMKSFEGVDYCWIEEGENVSQKSLDILIPTIRKTTEKKFESEVELDKYLKANPDLNYAEYIKRDELIIYIPSEIWIIFNPNFEDEPVYKKFITKKPDSCISIEINYWDVPEFFPATLRKEMEEDKANDNEKYQHIWCGRPSGAGSLIYASKYDDNVHVINKSKDEVLSKIAKVGNAFMSIDPHSKYYPYCLWIAIVPKENGIEGYDKIIYNEFPSFDYLGDFYSEVRHSKKMEIGLKELAQLIYSNDGSDHGIQIINRFVDTRYAKGAGGENIMTNSVGLIETWKRPENGSLILNTPPERMIDIQRLNVLTDLSFNKMLPISPFNQPNLYVCHWCKNTINFLKNHRETADGKCEDEKYKDGSDALRIMYAGIADHKYRSKVSNGKKIIKHSGWMG